ncbi:hypothetical protein ACUY4R_004042 [Kosakonia sp. BK9b]
MFIFAGRVLFTDQVTELVTRQDDDVTALRLAHIDNRLPPLAVGITADFCCQRAVAVLGAVLVGFPRHHAPERVVFVIHHLRRQRTAASWVTDHRRHLLRGVVLVLGLPPGVILLAGQQPGGGVIKTPLLVVGIGQCDQPTRAVKGKTGDLPGGIDRFSDLAARIQRDFAIQHAVYVLPAQ